MYTIRRTTEDLAATQIADSRKVRCRPARFSEVVTLYASVTVPSGISIESAEPLQPLNGDRAGRITD